MVYIHCCRYYQECFIVTDPFIYYRLISLSTYFPHPRPTTNKWYGWNLVQLLYCKLYVHRHGLSLLNCLGNIVSHSTTSNIKGENGVNSETRNICWCDTISRLHASSHVRSRNIHDTACLFLIGAWNCKQYAISIYPPLTPCAILPVRTSSYPWYHSTFAFSHSCLYHTYLHIRIFAYLHY